MELTTIWFVAIAGLWVGYFVLEGFDFGVGMLARVLGRGEPERGTTLATIGPVWDGNEVWLIVAAGATFAAFPEWYATLFSAFYLPLFAILIALIFRGVALEYRGKRDDSAWRGRCDTAIAVGSMLPAFLWGVVFANLLRGLPLDNDHEYVGSLADLFGPFALLGGITFTALFATHGAIFLALKTTGPIRHRATAFATRTGPATAALLIAFLTWSHTHRGDSASLTTAIAAASALFAALTATHLSRDGWAFTATALTIALTIATFFLATFPAAIPSTLGPPLTITTAAATPYTLKILTTLAAAITPFVLLYQSWTYWTFRTRLTTPS